jgi:ribose transport system substrate-binding protein
MAMTSRFYFIFGLLLSCLGLGAGCKSDGASSSASTNPAGSAGSASTSGRPLQLAFVTNNASEFWRISAAGIRKYEREAKVQVDVKMPPNGTTEEQNLLLENLSSQGYDAIAVSAIAPRDQVPVLDRVAQKSQLVTFDSDAPDSKRLLYIGTNNFEAGKVLGAEIVKLLPAGGKMAVFVGSLSADNAAQRLAGIVSAIEGKKIEIVDKREDNTDRAKARANVEDIINAHADLSLVAGLWSYNGPAIASAIESLGKKGKVLAAVFDEEEGTLDGIEKGVISVTVVQKPFQFGYLASHWMHELAIHGDAARQALPPSQVIDTGVEVIHPGNVGEYRKQLAELKR